VALVFRHMPLPKHTKAMGAALAMQAAARQGKAWPMHDKMFENNKALDPADLEKYAEEIGLDVTKFKADLDDPSVKKEIEGDMAASEKAGVRGTPNCFVNGTNVRGARPVEDFQAIVEAELTKAEAMLKQGVPLADLYAKRAQEK
jgi:predicted DsbA family dithiol-disulfide isomerase